MHMQKNVQTHMHMQEKYAKVYAYAIFLYSKHFTHMQIILCLCYIMYAYTNNFMHMQDALCLHMKYLYTHEICKIIHANTHILYLRTICTLPFTHCIVR